MSYARAVDVLLFGDASAPPLRPVTSPVKARRTGPQRVGVQLPRVGLSRSQTAPKSFRRGDAGRSFKKAPPTARLGPRDSVSPASSHESRGPSLAVGGAFLNERPASPRRKDFGAV